MDAAAEQRKAYEAGVVLFHRRELAGALPYFAEAVKGPSREISHSAGQLLRMCEHRIAPRKEAADSPEELYGQAIADLNKGRAAEAEEKLQRAVRLSPESDHIHYALGLCRAQAGDIEAASAHLKHAIELQPANRTAARNDADLAPYRNRSPLRELLGI